MPTSSTASESLSRRKHAVSPTGSTANLDTSSIYSQTRRAQSATSSRDILVFLIAFRVLNALCIQTFFQPDEYFQSLEPAWQIAFGQDAGAWITWEWRHHLRSTVHPYIFAAGYRVADFLATYLHASPSLRAGILFVAPKIVQAHIAACGDFFTWKLGERVYGRGSLEAWFCLALTVASPWQWFCSTRTLSNCLETTLTVVALTCWPWEWSLQSVGDTMADSVRLEQDSEDVQPEQPLRLRRCLILAAFACVLRPTNILIWIILTGFTLFRVNKHERIVPLNLFGTPLMVSMNIPELVNATKRERWTLFRDAILCGTGVLLITVFCDWTFYGQFTFSPYNFLYFNIAKSLAVFYGRNDWHYYLSQGYPLLLTTFLPFAAIGIYDGLTRKDNADDSEPERAERLTNSIRYQLANVSLAVPFILSFIAHKEVRFIYPILPLLHVLSSPAAAACIRPSTNETPAIETSTTTTSSPLSSPASSEIFNHLQLSTRSYKQSWSSLSTYRPTIFPSILLLNLLIAMFTTQHHQRGVLSVISYLRSEHEMHYLSQPPASAHLPPADTTMTVGFLMPCHSTPWRSHLVHPDIHAWALGCEPPIHIAPGPERETYLDEADQFYADPQQFLKSQIGAASATSTNKQSRSPLRLAAAIFGYKQSPSTFQEPSPLPTGYNLESPMIDIAQSLSPWNGGHGRKSWPEYLVFFEASSKEIISVISPLGYAPCWRTFNSWFHDDWRRRGDVIVWCRSKTAGMQDTKRLPIMGRHDDAAWKW